MNETYVATLFKRQMIDDDVYVFIPITVIKGKHLKDTKVFVDDLDNLYYDIRESHVGIDNRQEFFGFAVSLEELKTQYDTEDEKAAIGEYFEVIRESVYFGSVKGDSIELEIIGVPIVDIKNVGSSINSSSNQTQEEWEDDETKFYFTEPEIRKMLEMKTKEEVDERLNKILEFICGVREENEKMPEPPKKPTVNRPVIETIDSLDIADMYSYVTSKVINQDEAVKKILMALILNNISANSGQIANFQPVRTLITGPTGVGKTLIIETILEYLNQHTKINIPMAKVTTSELTAAGYKGMDLEDILEELVSKVTCVSDIEEKIKFAEMNGVVFFDEIDKKGSKDNGDVSGRAVLNALLQFLDGANYQISPGGKNLKGVNSTPYYFNTKYLNIFASGAFTNVKDEKNKTLAGFGRTEIAKGSTLTFEDCIKIGNMPNEFMGRLHQLVSLNPLEVNDLIDILNRSTASPILVESQELKLIGVDLSWDKSFVEAVAKRAYDLKLGARSLKTTIEQALFEVKWNAFLGSKGKVQVTSETVEDPKKYVKM